jgi:hypothetical protein
VKPREPWEAASLGQWGELHPLVQLAPAHRNQISITARAGRLAQTTQHVSRASRERQRGQWGIQMRWEGRGWRAHLEQLRCPFRIHVLQHQRQDEVQRVVAQCSIQIGKSLLTSRACTCHTAQMRQRQLRRKLLDMSASAVLTQAENPHQSCLDLSQFPGLVGGLVSAAGDLQ